MRCNNFYTYQQKPFLYIFGFFLLFPLTLSAQAWKADEYEGIPSKDKRVIINDHFEDDLNMWYDRYTKITHSNGNMLELKSYNEIGVYRTIPVYFNVNKNYQIEANLKWKKGVSSAVGLTFGANDMDNGFDFLISADGTFAIAEHDKASTKYIKTPTNGFNLLKDDFNLLTVRKSGTQWFFFINKEFVCEIPARNLFGNEVGFMVANKGTLNANSFAVLELISSDVAKPILVLTNPAPFDRGNGDGEVLKCANRTPIIEGRAGDISGIKEIKINGMPIKMTPDYHFAHQIQMKSDFQEIKIEASDNNGNTTIRIYTLQYDNESATASKTDNASKANKELNTTASNANKVNKEPNAVAAKTVSKPDEVSGSGPVFKKSMKGVVNHAIFIGIAQYQNWSTLNNTIYDCQTVSKTLLDKYQFDEERITYLYDEKATREGILAAFDSLSSILTEKDNVLIYYAGHGFYDSLTNVGYWVPVDAKLGKTFTYLSNTELKDHIKGFRTQHAFLIADACFAGSLFLRGDQILDEESRSRWAFTSGDMEYVNDGPPGTNSPFAKYLIQELESNTSAAIRADDLVLRVATKVKNNVAQHPKGRPIHGVGDEGGVFFFRKKR